jgi:hypothetical protein
MHFIYFLGRFHVVVLHLPIALVLVVACLEWLSRGGRRPELTPALKVMWPLTAATAVVTVIFGYMHFSEAGFTGPSAKAHRALGTSVGVVSLIGWWVYSHRAKLILPKLRAGLVILLVVGVFLTGHFGGNLTHGDDFLVAYAPNWMRKALGFKATRPPLTTWAAADPYLDVVRPIFEQGCFSCHNADKRRGGLDLSNYESVIKGGDDGPVIAKGNSQASDLIRRVSLSRDDEDVMPREGKPLLTSDQIAVLRWWIDSGAKTDVSLGSLRIPEEVQKQIAPQLHIGGAPSSPTAVVASAAAAEAAGEIDLGSAGAKADPKVVDALVNVGFMARQVSMADSHLIVSPTVPGTRFSADQLRKLASVAGVQITQLDLRNAGLDDGAVAPLALLVDLTHLHLDRNKLTDKTIQALGGLTKLQVLGLYGNASVTDASLEVIAKMRFLKHVFLWQTGVMACGVDKLRRARPDLVVDFGEEAVPASPAAIAPCRSLALEGILSRPRSGLSAGDARERQAQAPPNRVLSD